MSDRHLDFELRIDRGLAGAGTAEEQRAVEEHVAECAGCAEYLSCEPKGGCGAEGIFV